MPPVVDSFELGPIGTNCYVVRTERGASEAVVVDPSGDAATIRLELAGMSATCAGILVTHSHWDHILGLADLAEGTGAPVYGPEIEVDVRGVAVMDVNDPAGVGAEVHATSTVAVSAGHAGLRTRIS